MKYSPIKYWRLKNFRNIGDVTLDFTKSPIVVLKADNEGGKTSVVKSFEVVGYNGNSKGQKGYIRDDTNGFGISCGLEDGTEVTRIKTNSSNSFKVSVPGGVVFETNKMDSNEVPPEVANVMGMIMEQETKEPLHVRTYENQLLFVLTKPSENYKVMYDALKVDNLTKAIKDGSQEANALRAQIKSTEISIDTLTDNLKDIRIVDIEPAVKIKERLKAELGQIEKLESAVRLLDRNKELNRQLGSLKVITSLDRVELSEVGRINQFNVINNKLCELYKLSDRYKDIITMENINITSQEKINTLKAYITRNLKLDEIKERYKEIVDIKELNIGQIVGLSKCQSLIEANNVLVKHNEKYIGHDIDIIDQTDLYVIHSLDKVGQLLGINKVKSEENSGIKDKIHELQHQIRACGAIVGVCPNCSTDVIMEV